MRVATLLEVTDEGTFEHGRSVLRLASPLEVLPEEDRALLESALPRLEEARRARPAPGRDDKVITAWNALMATALARTGAALQEDALVDAEACVGFLPTACARRAASRGGTVSPHARLRRRLRSARQRLHRPYEVTGVCTGSTRPRTGQQFVRLFWDTVAGGLFYTDTMAKRWRAAPSACSAAPSPPPTASLPGPSRASPPCGRRPRGLATTSSSLPASGGRSPVALGFEALASAWAGPRAGLAVLVGEDGARGLLEAVSQHLSFTALALWPLGAHRQCSGPWLAGDAAAGRATAYLCEGFARKEPCRCPHRPARRGAGAPTGRSALAATAHRPRRLTLHTGSTAQTRRPSIGSRGHRGPRLRDPAINCQHVLLSWRPSSSASVSRGGGGRPQRQVPCREGKQERGQGHRSPRHQHPVAGPDHALGAVRRRLAHGDGLDSADASPAPVRQVDRRRSVPWGALASRGRDRGHPRPPR